MSKSWLQFLLHSRPGSSYDGIHFLESDIFFFFFPNAFIFFESTVHSQPLLTAEANTVRMSHSLFSLSIFEHEILRRARDFHVEFDSFYFSFCTLKWRCSSFPAPFSPFRRLKTRVSLIKKQFEIKEKVEKKMRGVWRAWRC